MSSFLFCFVPLSSEKKQLLPQNHMLNFLLLVMLYQKKRLLCEKWQQQRKHLKEKPNPQTVILEYLFYSNRIIVKHKTLIYP